MSSSNQVGKILLIFTVFLALNLSTGIKAEESGAAVVKNVEIATNKTDVSGTSATVTVESANKTHELGPKTVATSTVVVEPVSSTVAPTSLVSVELQNKTSLVASLHHTTGAPAVAINVTPIVSIKPTVSSIVTTTVVHNNEHANETTHRFCEYLKPICDSLEKILPKQLERLQSQFKTIIQKTNGKLSTCFHEHYQFDPALKPITQDELQTICLSRDLAGDLKFSYKSFKACVAKHWNPAVDKELDAINVARINCAKNHQHAKNDSNAALALHDDEESFALISDAVNKVLEGEKSIPNIENVKFIDMTGPTTVKPAIAAPSIATGATAIPSNSTLPPSIKNAVNQSILNDPNTVVVFVDDSNSSKTVSTTTAPAKQVNVTSVVVSHTSSKPFEDLLPSSKPVHEIVASLTPSTVVPVTISENKTSLIDKLLPETKAVQTKEHIPAVTTEANVTVIALGSTTAKPVSNHSSTIKAATSEVTSKVKVAVKETSVKPPIVTKPLESLEQVLRRQEKEKAALESKLRAEREQLLKQMHKYRDESDAHKAIKALQMQRQATAHKADNRLHQLEHDRQMAADPIGHTIKHQQYEIVKQQKLAAGGK